MAVAAISAGLAGSAVVGGLAPNPANDELNWPGARKRTSFWKSPLARRGA